MPMKYSEQRSQKEDYCNERGIALTGVWKVA